MRSSYRHTHFFCVYLIIDNKGGGRHEERESLVVYLRDRTNVLQQLWASVSIVICDISPSLSDRSDLVNEIPLPSLSGHRCYQLMDSIR